MILTVLAVIWRRMLCGRTLNWLPVRQHVDFKIAVLVFQCLTGHAPVYLADDCQLAADASARRLRSADTAKCVVCRTYNNFGDRCFAAAGPRLWNTLPLNLRLCDSLGQFKRLLKTFLLGLWTCETTAPCDTSFKARRIEISLLTYLLEHFMLSFDI